MKQGRATGQRGYAACGQRCQAKRPGDIAVDGRAIWYQSGNVTEMSPSLLSVPSSSTTSKCSTTGLACTPRSETRVRLSSRRQCGGQARAANQLWKLTRPWKSTPDFHRRLDNAPRCQQLPQPLIRLRQWILTKCPGKRGKVKEKPTQDRGGVVSRRRGPLERKTQRRPPRTCSRAAPPQRRLSSR